MLWELYHADIIPRVMKKWELLSAKNKKPITSVSDLRIQLLSNRGLLSAEDQNTFFHPKHPIDFTASDVGLDAKILQRALNRIIGAIESKESIVVYADYDADGITAGTIMWETIHALGGKVMPYIPHRVDEGYGLSVKGIDTVKELYDPSLIITVDHGITGAEKIEYAKSLGIEVIVTDHHTKGDTTPDCIVVHTTSLCGAGVSWFVAKELAKSSPDVIDMKELIGVAAIGTIADLVPLVGCNRSVVKYGLSELNKTSRVGLLALIDDAGMTRGGVGIFEISHGLAPRLNAMGRLEHAMDALRLLCTKQADKAMLLARKLGLTNKDRQLLTSDLSAYAKEVIKTRVENGSTAKLLFLAEESYNQGVIGLIAGKLVEEYYRPAIVIAKGELISKASARSIAGFNIVETIRSCSELLIDVGGHPMAAGFTVETKNLDALQVKLEHIAFDLLNEDMFTRKLVLDAEIPFQLIDTNLWHMLQEFAPFGFGNFEPVFSTNDIILDDIRLIGKDKKHLKMRVQDIDCVAFNFGSIYGQLKSGMHCDIAYSVDMNEWNGNRKLQLKIKDIHPQEK